MNRWILYYAVDEPPLAWRSRAVARVKRPIRQARDPEHAEGLILKSLVQGIIEQRVGDNALHLHGFDAYPRQVALLLSESVQADASVLTRV